jgi:hypothetical protein
MAIDWLTMLDSVRAADFSTDFDFLGSFRYGEVTIHSGGVATDWGRFSQRVEFRRLDSRLSCKDSDSA